MAEAAKRTPDSARSGAVGRGARKAAADGAVAPASLRGRVPALSPAQMEALRGFFSAQHSWLLADNGLLQFMPGQPVAAEQTFELDAEGTRLGLRLQATEVATGDGVHWGDYHGASRVLAWSLAHERHLMRLSEALGVALTPLVDPDPAHLPADALWLDFVIDDDLPDDPDAARRAPATQGALRLPATWLERVLTRAEPPFEGEAPTPLGRWRELPASVSLQLSVPPLASGEWAALRPGDVIVVGRRSRPPGFEARACGRLWPLSPDAQGWRVAGPARHIPRPQDRSQETTTMTTENEAPAPDEAPAAAPDPDAVTRQLPVQVTFEIGRLEMPVGELSALQAGYVFPVPAQLEGANVTIRANGEAVGLGELVAVGDTLGVRLLSWK